MPLTQKGHEIMAHMKQEYGAEEGERVFYASKAAGKITGVDSDENGVSTDHRAAGILFLTPDRKTLFLKRGPGGDCPGMWCFPGGMSEGQEETPEETARRETTEEAGPHVPEGKLYPHTRSIQAVPQGPVAAIAGGPVLGPDNVRTVDFTTFVQRINAEFVPVISDEHEAGFWASIDSPPEPLHPGCRVALDRFSWNELDVARAIRDGILTSPQRYGNMTLFDMRITGTGVAFRNEKRGPKGEIINPEEFVYRRPENYLTDEFVQRCNGLPVIMLHPKKAILDSHEFAMRTVGTMLLPYIKGTEVWGIAKVYDDDTINLLQSRQMSTSPSVLLGNGDQRMRTEDGTPIIIEGEASLLDHLAICEHGVWDKGGEPRGVRTDSQQHGDVEMPFTKEDLEVLDGRITTALTGFATTMQSSLKELLTTTSIARADDSGVNKEALTLIVSELKSVGEGLKALTVRMDDMERCDDDAFGAARGDDDDDSYKKRMDDAEAKVKADAMTGGMDEPRAADRAKKARHDAEERHKKAKADDDAKKKADDAARADAVRAVAGDPEARARIAALEATLTQTAASIPKQLTDEERGQFAGAQARADEVYMAFGKKAPYPLNGEGIVAYRRRLAAGLKQHSTMWKDQDILGSAVADSAFPIAEEQIYKDAAQAALVPADLPENQLRMIVRNDASTGRQTNIFVGRRSFVSQLKTPTRHVKTFSGMRKEA